MGVRPALFSACAARHARSLEVRLAGAHHGGPDIAQLREVSLAQGAAGLHHRRDALVEQVEQHLRQLRAGRVVDHGVGAHHHHRAHDFLASDLGSRAPLGAGVKSPGLSLLDQRAILRRQRIALEHHRFALIARAAIEPVHRNALGGSLEQQAVIVGLALPGLGAQFHLGAMARHHDDLIDGETVPVQGHGPVAHGRRDGRVVRRRRRPAAVQNSPAHSIERGAARWAPRAVEISIAH